MLIDNIPNITEASRDDIPRLQELFTETVRNVNSEHYTPEETEDWISCGDKARWEDLFSHLIFYIATDKAGNIIGFASVSKEGLLHSLFTDHRHLRQGVAKALLEKTEEFARKNGITVITSEVSVTAKPFFEQMGFTVIKEQERKAKKLYLKNYIIKKPLYIIKPLLLKG